MNLGSSGIEEISFGEPLRLQRLQHRGRIVAVVSRAGAGPTVTAKTATMNTTPDGDVLSVSVI